MPDLIVLHKTIKCSKCGQAILAGSQAYFSESSTYHLECAPDDMMKENGSHDINWMDFLQSQYDLEIAQANVLMVTKEKLPSKTDIIDQHLVKARIIIELMKEAFNQSPDPSFTAWLKERGQ